jgi:hypothetical protein
MFKLYYSAEVFFLKCFLLVLADIKSIVVKPFTAVVSHFYLQLLSSR